MIAKKIQNLFQFIDFLHSNIDNYKQYNEVISELDLLTKERKKLKPSQNYKDKLKYDKIQAKIKEKFNIIQTNIVKPIKNKAIEFNVCNFQNEPNYYFNAVADIQKLKKNFNSEDVKEILNYKKKYIEYRKSTHKTFLSLQIFFNDLDEMLKKLFDFFEDTEQNEFEEFEQKTIQVNSVEEMIKLFKKGETSFELIKQKTSTIIEPQQPNKKLKLDKTTVIVNYKHTHIFKDNAFEIWDSMFNAFEIKESSRTDIRFMYEAMKKDKLIHDTITLVDILNWINNVYEISLGKLPFIDINAGSNKNRRTIYNQSKMSHIK